MLPTQGGTLRKKCLRNKPRLEGLKSSDQEQSEMRKLLMMTRGRLTEELSKIKRDVREESPHQMRVSNDQDGIVDLSIPLQLAQNIEEQLKETEFQIAAIDNGTFGICQECSNDIEQPRLQRTPPATRCESCQEELDSIQLPGISVPRVTTNRNFVES